MGASFRCLCPTAQAAGETPAIPVRRPPNLGCTQRLGRATWQRDRFVALAAAGEGMIVTKPLHLSAGAGALEVNADAAGGQLQVELCRPDGRVLEGFSRADCLPLLFALRQMAGSVGSAQNRRSALAGQVE